MQFPSLLVALQVWNQEKIPFPAKEICFTSVKMTLRSGSRPYIAERAISEFHSTLRRVQCIEGDEMSVKETWKGLGLRCQCSLSYQYSLFYCRAVQHEVESSFPFAPA